MLKTKAKIVKWLKEIGINNSDNYSINDDLSINVKGNVQLDHRKIYELPVQFNHVTCYFSCANNQLTSLEGCPYIVDGSFYCSDNPITSLKYAPHTVGKNFICIDTDITSIELEDLPKHLGLKFQFNEKSRLCILSCLYDNFNSFSCDLATLKKVFHHDKLNENLANKEKLHHKISKI